MYLLGGCYLDKMNAHVHFIESRFNDNVALQSGGGLLSQHNNTDLVLAGCQLMNNICGEMGGGAYVVSQHEQFLVIDGEGYSNSAVLQSEHPYESGYPVGGSPFVAFSQLVEVDAAASFVLNFDPQTRINGELDTLSVYDSNAKTNLLFSTSGDNTALPGVDVPSLMVSGSTVYVELTGPSTYESTTYPDDFYGFKLYVYPVLKHPTRMSSVEHNSATNNFGGGIVLYSGNPFAVVINVLINGNTAKNAGALFFRDTNFGASLVQVGLYSNNALYDGAGVVVYTTNYGYSFERCSFYYNSAGA